MEDSIINKLLKTLKTNIEEQKYDDALTLIKANKDKFDPGIYHYNLATVYAKKEELVKARIEYEVAVENGYVSPELRQNLYKVKDSLMVNEAEKSEGFTDSIYHIYSTVPGEIFVTLVLLINIGVIFGLKNLSRLSRLVIVSTVCAIFTLSYYNLKDISVIILEKEKVVREGPSKIFDEVQVLPAGIKVLMRRSYAGFTEIIYPQHYKGWIEDSDIFVLRKY